jgi:DNA-binding response OmpR family regulator
MPLPTKILIVDDEQDICYFLTTNLSRRGFVTSFSNTLTDAEKKIKEDPPSILLLDNHLPDGRGVDFVTRITPLFPNLKIVMITAHDTPQDRAKAYANGINFFLSKPFTIAAINQVVDLVLGE